MAQPLPGPLQHVAPLLDHYGYAAVAAFVFVEGFGIPAPAVTVLVAASVYAGAGHLQLAVLVGIAIVAAILGDNVGYGIGHIAGIPALHRWGRYVRLTPPRLQRAEHFFTHRGAVIIPMARFIDGFRQTNGLIAGALAIPWRRWYLPLDALGAFLWVGVWASLGYVAGDHIGTIYATARRYETYLVALAFVAIVAVVAWHVIRRRRR